MWIRVVSLRAVRLRWAPIAALLALAMVLFAPRPRPAAMRAVSAVGKPVYRVVTSHRVLALTINVVWGTEFVPPLLRTLEREHVKATFMLGGAWAARHPALVRALYRAGMELGNHGYAHRHVSLLSLSANLREIERTNEAIAAVTGSLPRLFAPPFGEVNATVLKAADEAGMPLIMWTIDTIDWRPSSSPGVIADRVLRRAVPGAIVLMHPTDRTVEALPVIVRDLKAQGYRLETVSDLLRLGRPEGEN